MHYHELFNYRKTFLRLSQSSVPEIIRPALSVWPSRSKSLLRCKLHKLLSVVHPFDKSLNYSACRARILTGAAQVFNMLMALCLPAVKRCEADGEGAQMDFQVRHSNYECSPSRLIPTANYRTRKEAFRRCQVAAAPFLREWKSTWLIPFEIK